MPSGAGIRSAVALWTAVGLAVAGLGIAGCGAGRHRTGASAGTAHGATSRETEAPRAALTPLQARGDAVIRRLATLGLAVYCGGPHGNAVAFTFDDGPGVYTHYAVKKLTQAHEQATFFVVGKSIVNWPGWLQREVKVAALGDHTYTHTDLLALSPSQVVDEIQSDKQLIERQTGQPVVLFRPPYAARDATVDEIVKRLGLLDILWSLDSGDWAGANYAQITRTVERGLRPGAIVAMHENRGQTIRALTAVLPYLRAHHMRSVTLPELFATDPPSVAQLRAGEAGCFPGGSVPRTGVE